MEYKLFNMKRENQLNSNPEPRHKYCFNVWSCVLRSFPCKSVPSQFIPLQYVCCMIGLLSPADPPMSQSMWAQAVQPNIVQTHRRLFHLPAEILKHPKRPVCLWEMRKAIMLETYSREEGIYFHDCDCAERDEFPKLEAIDVPSKPKISHKTIFDTLQTFWRIPQTVEIITYYKYTCWDPHVGISHDAPRAERHMTTGGRADCYSSVCSPPSITNHSSEFKLTPCLHLLDSWNWQLSHGVRTLWPDNDCRGQIKRTQEIQ